MTAAARLATLALLACVCGSSPVHAQRATEQFIPPGESPGLSAQQTLRGRVESVDAAQRTLTVAGPAGSETVAITQRTRIWTGYGTPPSSPLAGDLADCREGRRVEIKLEDAAAGRVADWIKVERAD